MFLGQTSLPTPFVSISTRTPGMRSQQLMQENAEMGLGAGTPHASAPEAPAHACDACTRTVGQAHCTHFISLWQVSSIQWSSWRNLNLGAECRSMASSGFKKGAEEVFPMFAAAGPIPTLSAEAYDIGGTKTPEIGNWMRPPTWRRALSKRRALKMHR